MSKTPSHSARAGESKSLRWISPGRATKTKRRTRKDNQHHHHVTIMRPINRDAKKRRKKVLPIQQQPTANNNPQRIILIRCVMLMGLMIMISLDMEGCQRSGQQAHFPAGAKEFVDSELSQVGVALGEEFGRSQGQHGHEHVQHMLPTASFLNKVFDGCFGSFLSNKTKQRRGCVSQVQVYWWGCCMGSHCFTVQFDIALQGAHQVPEAPADTSKHLSEAEKAKTSKQLR